MQAPGASHRPSSRTKARSATGHLQAGKWRLRASVGDWQKAETGCAITPTSRRRRQRGEQDPGYRPGEDPKDTGTEDNAGNGEGKEGSFKGLAKMSPRHKRQLTETRKQYHRQEMMLDSSGALPLGSLSTLKCVRHAPSN